MENNNNKNKILAKVLAWISLVIITIFLFIIAYALVTKNGRLALAFTVGLIFFSVVLWIGIKLYKDAEEYKNLKDRERETEEFINISHMNTKNL